jgi:hypothetical protein
MKRVLVALAILLFCGVAFSQNRWINRDFKYTHSGMQDIGYPCPSGNPACYHSGWNFETAVGNYTDDYTNTYLMTYNAGGGAALLVDDGTWPNGLTGAQGQGWWFDGSAYLSRVDDGSFDMDPINNPGDGGGRIAGDFSVQCIVFPSTIAAGTDAIMSKWLAAGNERGWNLYRSAATVVLDTSVDGTAVTTNATGNLLAAYRPAFITATYDQSATTSNIFVDNNATVTSVAMSASINDSAADFNIGATSGGLTPWEGFIYNCAIYKGHVITEEQHDHMFKQWAGMSSTFARNVYTTTTSASPPAIPFAPPASGTEPFIFDNPANSFYIGSPVANSGGLYGASDLTSKWWRGSCETCAAGDCTGWTILDNQGGGAATVVADCDTTVSAHGGTSLEFAADNGGLPKNAVALGACQTNWIGQDVTLVVWAITTSGTASCALRIFEYGNGVCGGGTANPTIWGLADPGGTWTQIEGTLAAAAWNGATNSWRPEIYCQATGAAYTANFDAAMAIQAPTTFHTDASCTTDADADAVCTDTIHSIASPISANGQMSAMGVWRTPMAGTDLAAAAFLFSDGNSGAVANTYELYVNPGTDEPVWSVWDNAAASRFNNPNVLNWAADTDYEVVVRTGGNNDVALYWNAAWQTVINGAGTGVRNAAQATTYISGDHNSGDNVWTRNLRFFRRKLEVIP